MTQKLVKGSQTHLGNPFSCKRFKMAWDGLTAHGGINSLRKISLMFLVMPHTLSKLGCFVIFWPKRHSLHGFELTISPLPVQPHLIPLTFIQPLPTCSCPRVSAIATSFLFLSVECCSLRYLQDFFPCKPLACVPETPFYLLFLFSCFIFLHWSHPCLLTFYIIYNTIGDETPSSSPN